MVLYFNVPIVVTTVLEKNKDCPKLQLGWLETFLAADTPRLLALTTSDMRTSRSSSEIKKVTAEVLRLIREV